MSGKVIAIAVITGAIAFIMIVAALSQNGDDEYNPPTRADVIPGDAVKMTPATDLYPPIMHSDEWLDPVPMPGPVNTAGAEDSPFITSDGSTFYFFFTPDVDVPPEKQLMDGVTGIWWTKSVNGTWTEPERILLSDDVALDGAEFVLGDEMWFASVRIGNFGEIDYYTASLVDGQWSDVENAGEEINVDYDIGEMHITSDGSTMYFHTGEWSTEGDMDLWMMQSTADGWSQPVEVSGVNTPLNEGYPFVTADNSELWYTGQSKLGHPGPALYRCLWNGTGWNEAEEIVSNFAGECTIDGDGNLYFVHHYFDEGMTMLEADIYVAYRAHEAMVKGAVGTAESDEPDADGLTLELGTLPVCASRD